MRAGVLYSAINPNEVRSFCWKCKFRREFAHSQCRRTGTHRRSLTCGSNPHQLYLLHPLSIHPRFISLSFNYSLVSLPLSSSTVHLPAIRRSFVFFARLSWSIVRATRFILLTLVIEATWRMICARPGSKSSHWISGPDTTPVEQVTNPSVHAKRGATAGDGKSDGKIMLLEGQVPINIQESDIGKAEVQIWVLIDVCGNRKR